MRRAITVGLLLVVACGPGIFFATAGRAAELVELPTEEDVFGLTVGAETILFGPKGIETLLPGPVDDEEVVTVHVGPGDVPAGVEVRQRLVVTGLGDYRFKVSGPAQTVEALPDSQAEPGLRKGAVLWQGFAAEREVLSSEMLLFPDQEAIRLPLQVTYEQSIGGRTSTDPGSGELEARLSIENRSASPVTVTSARGDPLQLARTLDAIRTSLEAGKRPRPGEEGIPEALTATGGQRALTRSVPAGFRINGLLTFEGGELQDAVAEGGRVADEAGTPVVLFDGYVGARDLSSLEITLTGLARELGRPELRMSAKPAPPPPDVARPPGGGSWRDLVAEGAVDDTRPLWNRVMEIAWGVAKLRQYDAYLGNPDPTGEASTVYQFRLAAPAPPPSGRGVPPVSHTGTTPLLATTAILALLLLAFDGLLLWSLL